MAPALPGAILSATCSGCLDIPTLSCGRGVCFITPNQREMEPLATIPNAFVIASCLGHGWSLLHMLMQHPAPTRELPITTAIRGINASMPRKIQIPLSEQHCTAFFLLTKPQVTDLCTELPQCKLKHWHQLLLLLRNLILGEEKREGGAGRRRNLFINKGNNQESLKTNNAQHRKQHLSLYND